MLFGKDYHFKGRHADEVKQLTSAIDKEQHKIFDTNMSVYVLAPIIGFLYKRREDLDTTKNNGQVSETNILAEKMIKENDNLEFIYRLILLLDKEYEPDLDKRINKAFRDYGKDGTQGDMDRFDMYVRGGVDVIYEKVYKPSKLPDDFINNLYDLVSDAEDRWNNIALANDVLDLCSAYRG